MGEQPRRQESEGLLQLTRFLILIAFVGFKYPTCTISLEDHKLTAYTRHCHDNYLQYFMKQNQIWTQRINAKIEWTLKLCYVVHCATPPLSRWSAIKACRKKKQQKNYWKYTDLAKYIESIRIWGQSVSKVTRHKHTAQLINAAQKGCSSSCTLLSPSKSKTTTEQYFWYPPPWPWTITKKAAF